MSDNHAHARATEATDWLAGYDPGDGHGPVGPYAADGDALFTQPVVIAAFCAGADSVSFPATEAGVNEIIISLIRDAQDVGSEGAAVDAAKRITAYLGAIHRAEQDDWTIERATGQQQLDGAAVLIRETAAMMRRYEAANRLLMVNAPEDIDYHAANAEAVAFSIMAARLEAWLPGQPIRALTGSRPDCFIIDDPWSVGKAECLHPRTIEQMTGGDTSITFCPDCEVNVAINGCPVNVRAVCPPEVTVAGLFPGDDGYSRAEAVKRDAGLHPDVIEALRASAAGADPEPTKEA